MLSKELAGTGVTYVLEPTSRHLKVRLTHNDKSQYVVMSTSPSDERALKNQRRDVRRVVQTLVPS